MIKWCNIVFLLFVISCSSQVKEPDYKSQENASENGAPRIAFDKVEHDFGKITQGEKVGWYFKYKNEGERDLIINRVSASCGCTAPEFDRKPLPPGQEAVLKVVYDSSGRSGKEIKTVSVETNCEPSLVKLTLIVEVVNI